MSACRVILLETHRLSWAQRTIAALALAPARNQPINQSHGAITSLANSISRTAIVGACYSYACGEPARALADPSSAARERPGSPTRQQPNGRIAASRLLAATALFIASAVGREEFVAENDSAALMIAACCMKKATARILA